MTMLENLQKNLAKNAEKKENKGLGAKLRKTLEEIVACCMEK